MLAELIRASLSLLQSNAVVSINALSVILKLENEGALLSNLKTKLELLM